jgi:hypothetical protein
LSFKHKYTYDEKTKILLEYQAGVHGFRETRAISGGSIKTATRSSNLMAGNFVFYCLLDGEQFSPQTNFAVILLSVHPTVLLSALVSVLLFGLQSDVIQK